MAIIFKEENHSYTSIDKENSIKWTSVTSFIALFKESFDPIAASNKASKNPKSKWFKMKPEKIREVWKKENSRAVGTGSFYHDQRESDLLELNTIERRGVNIPIIKPLVNKDGSKEAPSQRLTDGIYPEHLMYLKSAGLCGQADRVEVVQGIIDIVDYKTNKEIKKEGYTNWEGITKKMLGPCAHLDDCNFNHYALQLSTYAYMINKHNPRNKIGKLSLHHVIFEKEGDDQFGYPIIKHDSQGNPIVKEIVPYEVPYLRREVIAMIDWLKDNKEL